MEKIYLAGNFVETSEQQTIINPFSCKEIAKIYLATEKEILAAIEAANKSLSFTTALSSFQKYTVLTQIAEKITEKRNSIADLIAKESAKPLRYALIEVDRAIETFKIAAEESKRLPKEYMSLDWTKNSGNKEALVKYFPIGVISGITPFNFPINLVAHKVAPAIAAGCPIILKPASSTPLTALILAKIIQETDWPKEAFSVLPCNRTNGNLLVTHPDISVLSFTGSPEVGWEMKKQSGKKKVILELGGNAGVLIDENCNLPLAVDRCAIGGFSYSGQICIHTQRIFVMKNQMQQFVNAFIEKIKNLKSGDPINNETEFSVMINESNAIRVEQWILEAEKQGAKILLGGKRKGNFVEPTILSHTNSTMKVNAEEVFGPVVIIESIENFEEGIEKLNDTRFGLQAGIFSDSHTRIQYAFTYLKVGGVIVNDVPTFRADQMPYGGIKDSGLGREGVKYAIQDYLEPKVLVF